MPRLLRQAPLPTKGLLHDGGLAGVQGCASRMHGVALKTCCMCSQDAGILAGSAPSTAGSTMGDWLDAPGDGFGVREEVCAATHARPHAINTPPQKLQ